jgi:hypothetical protein
MTLYSFIAHLELFMVVLQLMLGTPFIFSI